MHYHYLTIEQREILTNLIRSRYVSGAELEIALKRLHEPDYGVCVECGKDIGFVRLNVDPWALLLSSLRTLADPRERAAKNRSIAAQEFAAKARLWCPVRVRAPKAGDRFHCTAVAQNENMDFA